MAITGPTSDPAVAIVGLDVAEERTEERLVEAHVDVLSLVASPAADVALEDREQRRLDGERRGGEVGEADRREERLAVGKAVDVCPPRDLLGGRAETGFS
jgi:hypothetical protein